VNTIDAVLEFLAALTDLGPWVVGLGLEYLARLPLGAVVGIVGGFVALQAAFGWGVQRDMNRLLKERRAEDGPLPLQAALELEVKWSLICPVVLPLIGLVRLPMRIRRWASTRKAGQGEPASPAEGPSPDPRALLAPTHGPLHLLAAMCTAGVLGIATLAEPVLRASLNLSPGQPVYETLTLGSLISGPFFVPLSERFALAYLLKSLVLLFMYSALLRALRLFKRRDVGRNLYPDREALGMLPFWRQHGGATRLFAADESFRAWATAVGFAASAMLGGGLAFARTPPYQVPAGILALCTVLAMAWWLAIRLEGLLEDPVPAVTPPPEAERNISGWADVLLDLTKTAGVLHPLPHILRPRTFPEQSFAEGVPPLSTRALLELLPDAAGKSGIGSESRLTAMQYAVLAKLAELSLDERTAATSAGALTLETQVIVDAKDGRTGVTVTAPEDSGRSTLALLAAVDHVMTCSRVALVVVPDPVAADAFAARMLLVLGPSSLRWNVRVRRAGHDLVRDLDDGLVPDVVIASLQDLLSQILERSELLEQIGLLMVDDADEVAGPAETHAQLLFRRLFTRIRSLRKAGNPEAPASAKVLVLSGPSMHSAESWLTSVVGGAKYIAPMRFGLEGTATAKMPGPVTVTDEAPPTLESLSGEKEDRAVQVHHFLTGLRVAVPAEGSQLRARLRIQDVVQACERVGAPWCLRYCRDGERAMGYAQLRMAEEPRHRVDSPRAASVVFLLGSPSAIARERARLPFVGRDVVAHLRIPLVACLAVTDEDEARVFESIGPEYEEVFSAFPRPFVTQPIGVVRDQHLAAELLHNAVELGDVVEVFGPASLQRLRDMVVSGRAVVTGRRVLAGNAFRRDVFIRRQARSSVDEVAGGVSGSDAVAVPVRVDDASLRRVVVRDATQPELFWNTDGGTAHRRYYPHAIFEDARGRFEVTGRLQTTAPDGVSEDGLILVGPREGSEVSVPLRRTRLVRRGDAARSIGGVETSARKRLQLGSRGFDIETSAIDCGSEHVATLHVTPDGRVVKSRLIFARESPERVHGTFQSEALFIYPEPESRWDGSAPIDRDALRLLVIILRVVLRSAYRRGDVSVEVGVHVDEAGEIVSHESGVTKVRSDSPYSRPATRVSPEDALVLMDAQEGGNGAARAIARDGVSHLLTAALAYLAPFEGATAEQDARWRWLVLHDDVAPDSDDTLGQIDVIGEATARGRWERSAAWLHRWLSEHLGTTSVEGVTPSSVESGRDLVSVGSQEQLANAKYAVFNPADAKDVFAEIFPGRLEEAAQEWSVKDLLEIFEWMHAHIRYELDEVQDGQPDAVASVKDILARTAGDCEDMALLFASIAHHLGARCRVVLVPGHALCQVALGHRSAEAVLEEILELDATRARSRGLRPYQYPNYQGRLADGWEGPDKIHEGRAAAEIFVVTDVRMGVTVDPDGAQWLCVDAAMSRILGNCDPYLKAPASLDHLGRWMPGVRVAEYATEPSAIVVKEVVECAPSPDSQPAAIAPTATARRRVDDLGQVIPAGVAPAHTLWRRIRWEFAAKVTAPTRCYVVDLGTAQAAVRAMSEKIVLPPPELKRENGNQASNVAQQNSNEIPKRVLLRSTEAKAALDRVQSTLDAFVVVLKELLASLRSERDSEEDERRRASRLIDVIVGHRTFPPYSGEPRDRVTSLAQALVSGSSDEWARTLLEAELRRAMLGDAILSFDEHGWPILVPPDVTPSSQMSGRWSWTLKAVRSNP
jgi:hypothetical protein